MFSNRQRRQESIYLFIAILTTILADTRCEQLTLQTKTTNCTITFQTSSSSLSQSSLSQVNANLNKIPFRFVSCTRHLCLRNLMDGHCTNLQLFKFDEQKCYRQCCGASQFDMMKCQQYNDVKMLQQKVSQQRLVIVLTASLAGLIIAITVFVVLYMRCCSKEQVLLESKNNLDNQIHWKDCVFNMNKKCKKCDNNGAFIAVSCGTFYHLKCLNTNDQWECHHCDKKIKKLKFFCPVCLKKSIIIQASNFDMLDKKIIQLYELHPYKCFDQMGQQMDTERKFTQSTKQ